jgi:hypothetical protein
MRATQAISTSADRMGKSRSAWLNCFDRAKKLTRIAKKNRCQDFDHHCRHSQGFDRLGDLAKSRRIPAIHDPQIIP